MVADLGLFADYASKLGVLLGVIGVVLWLWLRPKIHSEFATVAALSDEVTRSKAREAQIEERLQEELKTLDRRMSELSAKVETLPKATDQHELAVKIAAQGVEIKAATAAIDRLSDGVTRIENYLLGQPRK